MTPNAFLANDLVPYFNPQSDSRRLDPEINEPNVGGVWIFEKRQMKSITPETFKKATVLVDEVDQFMDSNFDRLMQCKKVLAFTATMGGKLGSRQLQRKISNKLQFKEYFPPPPHLGEQLDIGRVKAYNFEMEAKCWEQVTGRAQAVEAVKQVIRKMPLKLQKQVLIIVELRKDATTIKTALDQLWEGVKVWFFDADVKGSHTKNMLELIRSDAPDNKRPEVVITTQADAVGVNFFKECCVIMM